MNRNKTTFYALVWLLLCVQGVCDLLPLFTPSGSIPVVAKTPKTAVVSTFETVSELETEETPKQHAAHCKCLRCTGGKTCCCTPHRPSSSTNATLNSCCDTPTPAQLVAYSSARLLPNLSLSELRFLPAIAPQPVSTSETHPSRSTRPSLRPPTA